MSNQPVSIEDYIDQDIAEQATTEEQRTQSFVITDERQAAWALRKMAEAEADIAQHTAEHDRVVKRAGEWLEQVTVGARQSIEFFEALLAEFHHGRLLAEEEAGVPESRRSKTIKLRTGTLTARKRPSRVEFEDEAAFVRWALDTQPGLLKMTPLKTEVKKRLVEVEREEPYVPRQLVYPGTGECAPGVVLVPGEISYSVSPATAPDDVVNAEIVEQDELDVDMG